MLFVLRLEASLSVWAIILLLLWGMCCVGPVYWMKPFHKLQHCRAVAKLQHKQLQMFEWHPMDASRHTTSEQPCRPMQWHCVRGVKEMDSKSIGICPQGFESPRWRFICMCHDKQLQRNWGTCKLDQAVEFYMPGNRCLKHQTSKALGTTWRTLTPTNHSHFHTFRLATFTASNDDLEAYLK